MLLEGLYDEDCDCLDLAAIGDAHHPEHEAIVSGEVPPLPLKSKVAKAKHEAHRNRFEIEDEEDESGNSDEEFEEEEDREEEQDDEVDVLANSFGKLSEIGKDMRDTGRAHKQRPFFRPKSVVQYKSNRKPLDFKRPVEQQYHQSGDGAARQRCHEEVQ